jgi:hypothetical protein
MRDQEVVRANRELAAYFKGRRTEREARAALKIIKAFIRDRERQDPQKRPALPGVKLEQLRAESSLRIPHRSPHASAQRPHRLIRSGTPTLSEEDSSKGDE